MNIYTNLDAFPQANWTKMTTPTAVRRRERGLDRALDIFEALRAAQRPLRPNEIASQLGAPRSTVHDLVRTLIDRRYLERADADGRVFLARRVYLLGVAYAETDQGLVRAESALRRVAAETGELAQYCGLDGNKYVVLRQHESARPFRISADTGHPVPIPWTASGRLLVSDLAVDKIAALIPAKDFVFPDGSRTSPADFAEEAYRARAAGHYTCDSVMDSFTHCFAVPVLSDAGRVAATLCLVAPLDDARRNHAHYLECLKRLAEPLHGHA